MKKENRMSWFMDLLSKFVSFYESCKTHLGKDVCSKAQFFLGVTRESLTSFSLLSDRAGSFCDAGSIVSNLFQSYQLLEYSHLHPGDSWQGWEETRHQEFPAFAENTTCWRKVTDLKCKEFHPSPSSVIDDTFFFIFFNWSVVDLQCCVNFCCTANRLSYTRIYILFYMLFHCGLSQDIEYSSLCYTVGPCCLSILYILVCIC